MNKHVSDGPISRLRQRLINDMTTRRFRHERRMSTIWCMRRCGAPRSATICAMSGDGPHIASVEDVRWFQIMQQEAGVPAPTMNSIVAVLRLFFSHTLDRPGFPWVRASRLARENSGDPTGRLDLSRPKRVHSSL